MSLAELPPELLALLQSSREAPDDPAPRLVLADWLEDDGQSDRADCVRLSCRLETLHENDVRRTAWRDELDDPRRETGRWLSPLRKLFPRADFHGGLIRVRATPADLLALALKLEDIPEEYLPWLETLQLRNFTTGFQLVLVARRGWLRPFTTLDLDETGLEDGAIQQALQDDKALFLAHIATLTFRKNQLTDTGVRDLVRAEGQLPALRSLDLSYNQRLSPESAVALAGSPLLSRLTSLRLRGTKLGPVGLSALANSRYAETLTHLDIGRNQSPQADGIQALVRSRRLSHLRSLQLDGCLGGSRPAARLLGEWPESRPLVQLDLASNLTEEIIPALIKLGLCGSLKELNLSENNLNATSLAEFLAALPGPGIQCLHLRHNTLGDEGATALASCSALSSLRELSLAGTRLGPRGMLKLARSPHLRGLDVLDLTDNALGAGGYHALAYGTSGKKSDGKNAIDPFPALRVLNLSLTKPTQKGIETLAGSPLLLRLENLHLSFNRLGAPAVKMLAESAGLKGLKHLSLNGCGLGDAGIAYLAASPHLAELLSIDLSENKITDAAIPTLVRAATFRRLTALALSRNRITDAGGRQFLDWKPDEWARFEVIGNRLGWAILRSLTLKGIAGS